MVPVCNNPGAATGDREQLTRLRRGINPVPVASTPERPVLTLKTTSPRPVARCGWCYAIVSETGGARTTRCPNCRRSLEVPTNLPATCERCGEVQHVPLSELGGERPCLVCGRPLTVGDVLLIPRRRRRVRSRRRRSSVPDYADAAWAVLIIGVTLLIALFSLTVM